MLVTHLRSPSHGSSCGLREGSYLKREELPKEDVTLLCHWRTAQFTLVM
jgi:hypothetical protein